MQPHFSLVVATVDRCDEMRPLLRSLHSQAESGFELVVVDQNADDRLLPLLAELRQAGVAVQHLRQAQRHPNRARNVGARAARAPWLAFPDDDCWYDPDTLARAGVHLADAEALDGVVGHWVEMGAPAPRLDLQAWRAFRGGEASMITLFLRRDAFLRWGGFDERIGPGTWFGGGEETDLMLRALTQGARWRFDAAVRVHHPLTDQRPLSVAERLRRARGTGALYAKHRLPAWVVLRGLLAPLLAPWRAPRLPLLQALATALGRWQGWLRWQRVGR